MGFLYKRSVDLTSVGSLLTDFQVAIPLTSANFDFTKAQANGEDVRFFADEDRVTPLSHWIESWDSVGETATVWVEVDSIPASGGDTIWMFYGDGLLSDGSDIEGTFVFGDEFTPYNKSVLVFGAPLFAGASCKIGTTIYVPTFADASSPVRIRKTTDNGDSFATEVTLETTGYSHPNTTSDRSDDVWASFINGSRNSVFSRRYTVSTTTLGSRITVASGLTAARDPVILRVSGTGASATLLCFFAHDDGAGNWKVDCYESTNGGGSWSFKSNVRTESKTGVASIEDLDAIVAGNGDILVQLEREVTEKGAASIRQHRSTDGGTNWGSETTIVDNAGADDEGGKYVLDEGGDIGNVDDLFVVYGSNKDGGTSYEYGKLFRLKSTDDGASYGSEETVWESHSNVEPTVEIDSNGKMLCLATKQYDRHTTLYQLVAFHLVESTDVDWSDKNWTQDTGLAYVVDIGGQRAVRVEDTDQARAFFANSAPSGGDYVFNLDVRSGAAASANVDIRVYVAYADSDNHYLINIISVGINEIIVYKRVAGGYTALDNVAFTPATDTWYDLKIQLSGSGPTTIKTWIDDVLKNNFTDSTYSGGAVGLGTTGATNIERLPNYFDRVRVRKFAATEPTPTVNAQQNVMLPLSSRRNPMIRKSTRRRTSHSRR